MKTSEQLKENYTKVIELVESFETPIRLRIDTLKQDMLTHIWATNMSELGYPIKPTNYATNNISFFRGCLSLSEFGPHSSRLINNVQLPPDFYETNKTFLIVSFSTGPYVLDSASVPRNTYNTELFSKLIDELKEMGPVYHDVRNYRLYFTPETGIQVFHKFEEILKKYQKLNAEQHSITTKEQQILELEQKLEQLKNS